MRRPEARSRSANSLYDFVSITLTRHLSITQYWMIYDGFGRREQLWSNVGSLSYTGYLYDGITPVQEQSSSGSKADSLTMPGSGEVLARTDSSGTVAPIYDGTGSTVWLVNSAGAIATQYMYEAYGKPTPALTASSNPFQFTGREHDPGGLYFMRNRYYSPTLSRFVSSDPIGFGGGDANLFRYAGGDPVNSSDPLAGCGKTRRKTISAKSKHYYNHESASWINVVRGKNTFSATC